MFLLCLLMQNLQAQKRKWDYERWPHEWSEVPTFESEVQAEFENEDIVILDETTELEVIEYDLNVVLRRSQCLKILTEKGLQQIQNYKLPPSLDPTWESYDSDINRQVRYQKIPQLSGELLDFGVRRIFDEKLWEEISWTDSIGINVRTNNGITEKHFSFHLQLEDLRVGDLIQIEYEFFFPYLVDRSNESNFTLDTDYYEEEGLFKNYRVFFHGQYPKQASTFYLTFPANEHYIIYEENGVSASDYYELEKPKRNRYAWNFDSLPGCMTETGIRPHLDLPFIHFYRHNRTFGLWSDFDLLEYRPYSWAMQSRDKLRFRSDHARMFGGISAKQKGISRMFDRLTIGLTDTLSKLEAFHKYINNELAYQDDAFWYMGVDNRLERMKGHLRKGLFREISRHDIYDGLMNRLGIDYYHTFIIDKRIGLIDINNWKPVLADYRWYTTRIDNKYYFIFPKNNNTGLLDGELPFYLSGTTAWAVKQTAIDRFQGDNILFLQTPMNSAEQNARNINVEALIDSATNKLVCQTVIDLSGQFSTMSRPFYEGDLFLDPTINPLYHQSIFGEKDLLELMDYDGRLVKDESPYTYEVITSYAKDGQVSRTDSSWTIFLKDMFPHVVEQESDSFRDLPYYPDFRQTDRITYRIYLPESCELLKFPTFVTAGTNWSYQFDSYLVDEKTLQIESTLSIDQAVITAPEYENYFRDLIDFIGHLQNESVELGIIPVNKK